MTTTPITYFEQMYAADPDPWSFETRWYDARKHALTVDALPRRRYRSGFEPGCSTGRLTQRLAARCEALLAVDAVDAAVEATAERVRGLEHVTVRRETMPAGFPPGPFDLIVLSEIGYYFGDADLSTLIDRAAGALEPGGDLVAVHWRWPVAEHARNGDDVHRSLAADDRLARLARHEEADFLLEVFTRVPTSPLPGAALSVAPPSVAPPSVAPPSVAPLSVAQREGLA